MRTRCPQDTAGLVLFSHNTRLISHLECDEYGNKKSRYGGSVGVNTVEKSPVTRYGVHERPRTRYVIDERNMIEDPSAERTVPTEVFALVVDALARGASWTSVVPPSRVREVPTSYPREKQSHARVPVRGSACRSDNPSRVSILRRHTRRWSYHLG